MSYVINPPAHPIVASPANRSTRRGFGRRSLRWLAGLSLAVAATLHAEDYTFTTIAGVGGVPGYALGSQGGVALPLFSAPTGIVIGSGGNLYVTDSNNAAIRVVTPQGVVTTLAGTTAGSTDGTGTAASFRSPQGPAVDSSGNLYIADFSNSTIRKVTPAGVVTTFAGLAGTTGLVNGKAADARFSSPSAVAIDSTGNLYVTDTGTGTVRKIATDGTVSTLAGAPVTGSTDGTGSAANFNHLRGIAVDGAGNVYVADALNNAIRKITPAGVVTTFAGKAGFGGLVDATGADARFTFPNGLAFDSAGNLYVADEGNNAIRKITPAGVVTTVAGNGSTGRVDATGPAARFDHPTGLIVDSSGNIYVADNGNQLIRKISAAGAVTTIAGTGGVAGMRDGSGYAIAAALYSSPIGASVDSAGNVYVADTANQLIRKIALTGESTILAGALGVRGTDNGTSAKFNSPSGTAVDAAGNVYVADTGNHAIRKIAPGGTVSTFAGKAGESGYADGADARFNLPAGVAVDSAGNVYVADYGNDVVRKIAPNGTVSTLAGTAGSSGAVDGAGSSARFNGLRGVAVDSSGNVYVADSGNHAVRKITAGGFVTTLAGTKGMPGSADGSGGAAGFKGLGGIAVDGAGNVYVADTDNNTIRLVTPAGAVTTIGGTAGSPGNVDGKAAAARFNHPTGIAVDASGVLYIVDNRNHLIREGYTSSTGTGIWGSSGAGSGHGSGNGSGGNGSGGDGSGNGSGSNVGTGVFLRPAGLVYNGAGTLFVADTANHSIKAVVLSTIGTYSTLAGKDGTSGSADGTGAAASFNSPMGITLDGVGNLFVCDSGNAVIRKVTPAGVVTTFAGTAGSSGSVDATGTAARFYKPVAIARDASDNLYVVDAIDCTIRKITSAGVVTTLAGASRQTGDADGTGSAARFNNPSGIAIDGGGNLYVADTYNNTIRKVTTDGVVTTLAGSAGLSGSYDGTGGFALFSLPNGITADSAGTLFVADTGNNAIRRVSTTGITTTVAGIPGISGNRDGVSNTALFNQPQALAANGVGSVFVADTGNSKIRSTSSATTVSVGLTAATAPSNGGSGGSTGGGGGGGGGAVSPWSSVLLAALLLGARRFRRAA